jgi:hypothetical protein
MNFFLSTGPWRRLVWDSSSRWKQFILKNEAAGASEAQMPIARYQITEVGFHLQSSLVAMYWCFGGTYCIHLQVDYFSLGGKYEIFIYWTVASVSFRFVFKVKAIYTEEWSSRCLRSADAYCKMSNHRNWFKCVHSGRIMYRFFI